MLLKLKRQIYQFILPFRVIIYFGLISAVIIFLIWMGFKIFPVFRPLRLLDPAITQLTSFRDRTNILLLGMAGGDHAGADLTDSIMLISIDLKTSDTVLISLPRDIWIESLMAKLNTAYHYGEAKEVGGGLVLAKSAVAEITNQPIHYAAVLDFSGFAKAIDVIGGITLDIPRGFTDTLYPIPGKEAVEPESDRYETVQFSAGRQRLNGATALKYVRSRHAEGEEGSDFSRAQRQQRVLLAFKERIFSPQILLNPVKLKNLYREFKAAVKTDLPSAAYPDLAKLALRIKSAGLRTGIVDQGNESEEIPGLLYNPPVSIYGQWVLIPTNNNWQAIYDHVAEILYQNQSDKTQ